MIDAFVLIVIHWVADFVLQTDWQAKNKSSRWDALLLHTGNYSIFFGIVGAFIVPAHQFDELIYFVLITFAAHTATDYFTSRLNSKLWKANKVHEFFVSVGFDQVLHYGQLFLTYHLLTK